MVEVDEEGPVEEPCAGVKLAEGGVGVGGGCSELRHGRCTCVDGLPKRVELLEGDIPLASEDVARELTPVGGDGEIGVGREDAEVVEVICSARVVSVRVLELAEVVECGDLFERDLCEVGKGVGGLKTK